MKLRALLTLLLVVAACSKKASESAPPPAAGPDGAPAAAAAPPGPAAPAAPPATGQVPAHEQDNLFAVASGAMVIAGSKGLEGGASPWFMFDEDTTTGYSDEQQKLIDAPIVVELPDRVLVKTLVFDEAKIELDSRLGREIDVDISDKGASGPWTPIAAVTPDKQADDLRFPVSAEVPGRWLRITTKPNRPEGSTEISIQELRAYGERLTHSAPPKVAGSYELEDYGWVYLEQDGAQVTGCAERATEPIVGGLEGRLLRFRWHGTDEADHGPGIMIFGDEGRVFAGYFNETIEHPSLFPMPGKKTSDKPGACPGAAKKEDPIAAELKKTGRVRLYGINFDLDSDKIRDESKPTLAAITKLLEADKALSLTIEGHTDDSGTPEHNQKLSEARAASVKAYLVAAGIDAKRLEPTGFGATKPVAPNTSAIGRAQNRRVEVVRR